MLRKASETISEGNGGHQEEELRFGQPAPVDDFREIRSQFDKLRELMRRLEQHLVSQEKNARQQRLAMEADGHENTKTQRRTEDAAKAVQAMPGNSIVVLLNKMFKMDRRPRSLSVWKPDLPISLAEKTFWSRRALRRPSHVSHPRTCAHQQPAVA